MGMKESEVRPSVRTYSGLIHCLCRQRMISQVVTILAEMKAGGLKPDVIIYTALVRYYCQRRDQSGVEKILRVMKSEGIQPDRVMISMIKNMNRTPRSNKP